MCSLKVFKECLCVSSQEGWDEPINLLELDQVVVRDHLFPLLKINDLLRLRRVSKSYKHLVDDYIKTRHIKSRRELVTNFQHQSCDDDDPDYQYYLWQINPKGLPITTSRVRFSSMDAVRESVLYTPCVQNFIEICGTNITHLTLPTMGIPLNSKKIVSFFECFPNVTHLVFEDLRPWICWGGDETSPVTEEEVSEEIMVPSCFKHLKYLTIVCNINWGIRFLNHKGFNFVVKLVEECKHSLRQLSLPYDHFMRHTEMDNDQILDFACKILTGPQYSFKLADVDGYLIEMLLKMRHLNPELGTTARILNSINERVVSLRNPETACYFQEFPNLEKIHYKNMYMCSIPDPGFEKLNLPKLNEIVFCADNSGPPLYQVIDFLFVGIRRDSVVKLDISLSVCHGEIEAYPKAGDVVSSCPNLKFLKLQYWARQHETMGTLWRGLPLLEELCIDCCRYMGNDAFFGENPNRPAFLALKRLKILHFSSVELMYITDDVFSKIIRRMPLKEFHISSSTDHVKFTLKGIKSLLTGKFAKGIQVFTLDQLRLKEVTSQQMRALQKQFRSARMI